MTPRFPDPTPLKLDDRPVLHPLLRAYQPVTSELTFTNLFTWRHVYQPRWCLEGEHLVMIGGNGGGDYGLPPIGPAGRAPLVHRLLDWLRDNGADDPRIERADARLAEELSGDDSLTLVPERDQFDYLYPARELAELPGNRYHAKRNHIAALVREHDFEYRELTPELIREALVLADRWCRMRRCCDDLGLHDEFRAMIELLLHYTELQVSGAAILVAGRMEAFTVGEQLNDTTAVIHLEKADPGLRGLYPLINREFAARRWSGLEWINREQDLGLPGLRQAKESYHPTRLEPKFTIRRRD